MHKHERRSKYGATKITTVRDKRSDRIGANLGRGVRAEDHQDDSGDDVDKEPGERQGVRRPPVGNAVDDRPPEALKERLGQRHPGDVVPVFGEPLQLRARQDVLHRSTGSVRRRIRRRKSQPERRKWSGSSETSDQLFLLNANPISPPSSSEAVWPLSGLRPPLTPRRSKLCQRPKAASLSLSQKRPSIADVSK